MYWLIHQTENWDDIFQKLKRFIHSAEKSPQERLYQVHRRTYLFWTSLKEITFCSLKHYSNISTSLSCFLIKKVVLREFFHKPVWWDKQRVSKVSLSLSVWLLILVSCGCYSELVEGRKRGHLVTLLTSFTAKCKKHNRECAAGQMDTLQLKTFLKEKDPGSFHFLTVGAYSRLTASTWHSLNCSQLPPKTHFLNLKNFI